MNGLKIKLSNNGKKMPLARAAFELRLTEKFPYSCLPGESSRYEQTTTI
ncbi:hypothetical protein QTU21_003397 [Salmonella enterica]|nr:hypothetical protein [Salmonella enterica]ELX2686187.1 hypothetical protein [Salmonella enterica]